ncbi:MAG: bifunctional 4-hydroxy-2-oxoglutarate aldolase/2-dehydro-3-deoxy-phosphogluconate aldolase [Clostridia bacterium]|nr:bifunctional 4-hydroxy-2-oxoglutarate aldolase/2-dehydro-3-deoxy-phosphogluconate aldolase [Clostridia bacterium]
MNTREQLTNAIIDGKIIAIARGITASQAVDTARALYAGGIKLMEITFDQSGKLPFSHTLNGIRAIREKIGGKLHVGAGTVLNVEQVELAAESGAEYIISPDVNEDVIRRTLELGLISIPGAMTPSEITRASNSGADFVKLFPAGALGTDYIRAIRAPLSHVKLLAVGGVSDSNIAQFIASGCVGAGIGGNLVNRTWIADGKYDAVTQVAKKTVAALEVQ